MMTSSHRRVDRAVAEGARDDGMLSFTTMTMVRCQFDDRVVSLFRSAAERFFARGGAPLAHAEVSCHGMSITS